MNEKKDILKNFAGIALATGVALVTSAQGNGKGFVLEVIGGIAGNLASNFIEKAEYNKFSKLLRETNPSELNHDLKKLVVKAIEWAVLNIQILYKKELMNDEQKAELRRFTNHLLDEVKVLNDSLGHKEQSVQELIEMPNDDKDVFNAFNFHVSQFPVIREGNHYGQFFKKHFIPNLQLCFGELLKQQKNHPAYIAYQREIYQKLNSGVEKIIERNDQILEKITSLEKKQLYQKSNRFWRNLSRRARKRKLDVITLEFESSFNNQLDQLTNKIDLVYDYTIKIDTTVEEIKRITIGINRDLKKDWIEKNKVVIFSLAGIATVVICFFVYKNLTREFDVNISVKKDTTLQIHDLYPEIDNEAKIHFYMPSETITKEITFSNEMSISELPYKFLNTTIQVELNDPYWELSVDTFQLNKGHLVLLRKPNGKLGKVYGSVMYRKPFEPVQDVKIEVEGEETKTDRNGKFELYVPIEKQRQEYNLLLTQDGKESLPYKYVTLSPKLIHINR